MSFRKIHLAAVQKDSQYFQDCHNYLSIRSLVFNWREVQTVRRNLKLHFNLPVNPPSEKAK